MVAKNIPMKKFEDDRVGKYFDFLLGRIDRNLFLSEFRFSANVTNMYINFTSFYT